MPLGVQEGYKTLFLHNNQINNAGFPLELHNVASVETVYLYGNQLELISPQPSQECSSVAPPGNNIQTISRAALPQLPMLEELPPGRQLHLTVGVEEGGLSGRLSASSFFSSPKPPEQHSYRITRQISGAALDENRIADIYEDAFQNVTTLQRLLLDGNLLEDEGIAPGTFRTWST